MWPKKYFHQGLLLLFKDDAIELLLAACQKRDILYTQALITAVAQNSWYETRPSAVGRYPVCIFFGVVLLWLDDRNQPGLIFSILPAF